MELMYASVMMAKKGIQHVHALHFLVLRENVRLLMAGPNVCAIMAHLIIHSVKEIVKISIVKVQVNVLLGQMVKKYA